MKRAVLLFSLLLASGRLGARPLRLDLGDGLGFLRVHELPGDLAEGKELQGHPLVLDLRYVRGGPTEAAALIRWLRRHAAVRRPVLLLANSGTSPALLAPLGAADAAPGVVIIGPDTAGFAVDIAVTQDPKAERKAYEALEKGAKPRSLVDNNPPKPRDDEARLERDHLSDADPDEPPLPPDEAAEKWTPPLVDRALQRAVQVDRGLLALKRL